MVTDGYNVYIPVNRFDVANPQSLRLASTSFANLPQALN